MYKILDCTIRDGGHQNNWEFEDEFVFVATDFAAQNGCEYFEIGYRNFSDNEGKGKFYYCTPKLIEKYKNKAANLKIGIMTDTSRFCIDDFKSAEYDCIDFVRIATHPQKIKETLIIAQELHSRGYKVFVQLMEIPNVLAQHYKILTDWNYKNIIESLYIADTYSTVKPQDLELFFEKLHNCGYEKISFHAHNNHGLALENTLKAIELGAYSIDLSQDGLGGNLSFKTFLNVAKSVHRAR